MTRRESGSQRRLDRGDERRIVTPEHQAARSVMRLLGPGLMALGLIFVVVGMVDFFSVFGARAGAPTKFWCFFVGMPLLAIGGGITKFAFLGTVGRYLVGETAPVAKDTINYMASNTSDAVREIASAVGDGLRGSQGEAPAEQIIRCHKCNAENAAEAKFCMECGEALTKSKPCPDCSELNDPDARFCDNCGREFASST